MQGPIRFCSSRNDSTRIDRFEELSHNILAVLRSFCRRLGAPHLLDEVIMPTLQEGDAQLFAAVRDRPWPPWGLGAQHVSALCEVHTIADESYAISPVYVTDEDITNVGLISAVYKEVLESIATSPSAAVNYLVAEGSTIADHVLTMNGFRKYEDILLTEHARDYTYRIAAAELLRHLDLDGIDTPDLLAHEFPLQPLERNALFHQTIYLGSRAEWSGQVLSPAEIIRLVRGRHAGKPGGVPSGTGRRGDPSHVLPPDVATGRVFSVLQSFLGEERHRLMEYVLSKESELVPSTVEVPNAPTPVVNERLRRSKVLTNLGQFEVLFTSKLKEVLSPTLSRLGYPTFPVGRIEIQITASGDRDYFRLHRDGGNDSTREISFVYFLYREPRRFSGGELRMFDTRQVEGTFVPTDESQMLSPRQDTIVFFPSRNEHEILPVRVPAGTFGDSRFTVNGWIHRT